MLSTFPEPSKYAINNDCMDNDLVESPSSSLRLIFITSKWRKKTCMLERIKCKHIYKKALKTEFYKTVLY